jgi:hypothetical protein
VSARQTRERGARRRICFSIRSELTTGICNLLIAIILTPPVICNHTVADESARRRPGGEDLVLLGSAESAGFANLVNQVEPDRTL